MTKGRQKSREREVVESIKEEIQVWEREEQGKVYIE
jgi:hypothetical protein